LGYGFNTVAKKVLPVLFYKQRTTVDF